MCLRSAAIGDVLELSYQVRLKEAKGEKGLIVDGAKTIAAEGNYSWLKGTHGRSYLLPPHFRLQFCITLMTERHTFD